MTVKNAVLLGRAQAGKQWQHLGVAKHRLMAQMFAQVIRRLTNLALARQKNQDVTGVVRVAPQLVHTVGNGVVQVVVTRLLKRSVTLLHREHAARHHDDRCWSFCRFKVIGKTLRINRGGRHHDLQVGPARQDLAQVAQQEVDVQAAFVRLVDDEGVVGQQQRIGLRLGQQDAVGHQLDRGVLGQTVLKAHLEADHLAQWCLQFLRNSFGNTAGGNAAWLGVTNQLAARRGLTVGQRVGVVAQTAAHRQRNLGQLGGLARTSLATHDDDLVRRHGRHDFFAFGGYGQGLGELDLQRWCGARWLGRAKWCLGGRGVGSGHGSIVPQHEFTCYTCTRRIDWRSP